VPNYALLQDFLADESGVTALEYALIGSLIAVAIVTTVTTLGLSLGDMYDMVSGKVKEAVSGA
jgi:pilus assembly protein Flp/PilA